MASRTINPNQIIRVDGKGCFVEVMKDAFAIQKVLFRFYSYDETKQASNRITRKVFIYMSFKDFYNFYYKTLTTGALIKEMQKTTGQVDRNGDPICQQVILSRGGKKSNGSIIARQLKIFKGRSTDIVLRGEEGPGKENAKGGYTMSGAPSQYITVGMDNDSLRALLGLTYEALSAYYVAMAVKSAFDELLFEMKRQRDLMSVLFANRPEAQEILNREMPKPWEQDSDGDRSGSQNQGQNYNQDSYYDQGGYYENNWQGSY